MSKVVSFVETLVEMLTELIDYLGVWELWIELCSRREGVLDLDRS